MFFYGNAAKQGAEIALEEINAMGGLQFELRYEDDAHDAEKAVNAYNTLKDWGMLPGRLHKFRRNMRRHFYK